MYFNEIQPLTDGVYIQGFYFLAWGFWMLLSSSNASSWKMNCICTLQSYKVQMKT